MSYGQTIAIFIAVIGGAYVIGDWPGRLFVRRCRKAREEIGATVAEPNDWNAVTVEGMDAPVAGLCFKSGCHYAALLQARAEIANLQAEIIRLKSETK